MNNTHWTIEGWLLVSAFCFIVALFVEDDPLKAILWGLGILFLPILFWVGVVYAIATAIRGGN